MGGVLQRRLGQGSASAQVAANGNAGANGHGAHRRARSSEGEQLVQAIFAHALDAIAIVDDERRYVAVNPACCELFGAPEEELCGRRIDDFTAPTLRAGVEEAWRAYLETGEQQGEFEIERADGEVRVVDFRARARVLPGRHLSVMRDVTDERRAQSELAEATERFARAFDDAPIGIALVELTPAPGRLLAANRRIAELFGSSQSDLLELDPATLSHPDDVEVGLAETERLLRGEIDSYSLEKRFLRRDGEPFWARLQVSIVRGAASAPYAVVQVEDVSAARAATEALRESEARFRRLAESAEDVIFVYRLLPEPGFEYVNDAAARLTGYTVGEFLADPELVHRVIHPDDRETLEMDDWFEGPRAVRWVTRGGRTVWTEQRVVGVHDDEGQLVAVQGIARDITERRRTEEELERLALVVEATDDAIISTDEEGHVTSWSPGAERLYGFTAQEMLGRRLDALMPPDLGRTSQHLWRRAVRGERVSSFETRRLTKAGESVEVSISAAPVYNRHGELLGTSQIARDITERRRMERALRHYADNDPLTGLYNRRRFEEALAQQFDLSIRAGDGAALVIVDIDHFKVVNDSLGHTAGDRLIRSVAGALRDRTRKTDVLARLGGDEFAVLAVGVGASEAERFADDLLEAVRGCSPSLAVTASAAVAPFPAGAARRPEDVWVAADMALNDAKEGGRNQVRVSSGGSSGSLGWLQEVREAVVGDRLRVDAQPLIDLSSGGECAEELLVRMVNASGEVVPPGQFLGVAERFDLIADIDRWVVGRAIELARAGGRYHVNLSGRSIANSALLDWIAEAIAEAELPEDSLVFEVTETTAIANLEDARSFSDRLRALGCGVALDDFGTGFGSFTYLKYLPVTHLKIDMEFVRSLADSEDDQRIVRSIVDIARGKGIRTVAEGVEDAEALALLREYGVDGAQGFHIGRPRPKPSS